MTPELMLLSAIVMMQMGQQANMGKGWFVFQAGLLFAGAWLTAFKIAPFG